MVLSEGVAPQVQKTRIQQYSTRVVLIVALLLLVKRPQDSQMLHPHDVRACGERTGSVRRGLDHGRSALWPADVPRHIFAGPRTWH